MLKLLFYINKYKKKNFNKKKKNSNNKTYILI